jgi:hypothetical protein
MPYSTLLMAATDDEDTLRTNSREQLDETASLDIPHALFVCLFVCLFIALHPGDDIISL